ncbi:hypothetical protein FRB94_004665 [Tulasnella sp. JGI-2019a]|nr:hypothetical protein FRB94_004665 [Tulasnella sp. JGI-2019a]
MKRALANSPNEESRPTKVLRTMGAVSGASNSANDPFATENEVPIQNVHTVLNDGQPYASSDKYIDGVVNMAWASAPGDVQRFLLNDIEIKFTGCKENLPSIRSSIKVSLMGAVLGASKNSSVKIQYNGGILMQETKRTGEVVETDLFSKDDWFGTPLDATSTGPPMEPDALSPPASSTEPRRTAHEVEKKSLSTPDISPTSTPKLASPDHCTRQNHRNHRDGDSSRDLNAEPDEHAFFVGHENRQVDKPSELCVDTTSLDDQQHRQKMARPELLSTNAVTNTAAKPPSLARTATASSKSTFTPSAAVALTTPQPGTKTSAVNARRTSLLHSEHTKDVPHISDTSTNSAKGTLMGSVLGERDGQRGPVKQQRQDKNLSTPASPSGGSARRESPITSQPRIALPPNEQKGKKKKRHDQRKSEPRAEGTTIPPIKAQVNPPNKELSKMAKKKQAAKEYLDMKAGYDCSQSRPGHYHPLNELKDKAKVCFVGIVVEIGEAKTTVSGDLQTLVSLVDPSWRDTRHVVTVQCFAPSGQPTLLPVPQLGQPLLIRMVKIQEFNGRPSGIAYKGEYAWACYNPTSIGQVTYNQKDGPEKQPPNAWIPTEADLHYLKDLSRWWAASEAKLTPDIRALIDMKPKATGRISIGGPADPSATALARAGGSLAPSRSHKKRGLCFIRDVEPGDFFDCVAQVTNFGMNQDIFSIMYATDYTRHRDMFAGSADRSLKISLWNDDRVAALNLTENTYHLRNIFAKIDKEGKLEGQMRSTSGSSFKLLPKTNKEVQALLLRKAKLKDDEEYNDWPSLDTGVRPSAGNVQPTKEPVVPDNSGIPIIYPSTHTLVRNRWARTEFTPVSKMRLKVDEPRNFRIAVRVMEYQPSDFREWIYAFCTICGLGLPAEHQRCVTCGDDLGDKLKLSYRFQLRVRDDQGDEVDIFAAGEEAADFLGAFPAKYLDTTHDLQTFTDYVIPILCKRDRDNDEVPGPLIDICVQGRIVDGYHIYNLYGTELDVAAS